ncbi:malonyl-ACP O-methyltransferase BioC [Alteromonas sp. D210916BOD_24]|uniref:methyltransferase domain-containing protein n=1 Tax=Alteromonas sp. D210916BOD_24 TaxID=3157618 RepID=UPI00399CA9A0
MSLGLLTDTVSKREAIGVDFGTSKDHIEKRQSSVTHLKNGVVSENAVAKRFSKAAVKYDALAGIQKRVAEQTLGNLPAQLKGNAIDIGCGTGIHTSALHARGANAFGIDIAEGMLTLARQNYPKVKFVQASALALPFHQATFNTVFSSMALQWVKNTFRAAQQIAHILAPCGVAELAIMVDGSFEELKNARKMAHLTDANTPMANSASWEAAFNQAGLSVSRVITRDYVDTHPDIMSLLRSVKGVGAGETGKHQAPLSRQQVKALSAVYHNTSPVQGELPLTYRISHFRLEKK